MKQALYETAQKILSVNKKALRSLHDIFGFDFEEKSSVEIKELKTPFTLAKVVKENNLTEKFAVVIIKDRYFKQEVYHHKFFAVIVDSDGKFDIESFTPSWSNDGIDNYYRKADFNEDRKNPELEAYLITMDKKDEIFSKSEGRRWNQKNVKQAQEKELAKNYIHDTRCLNRIRYDEKDLRKQWNNKVSASRVTGVYNARLDNYNAKIDIDFDCHIGYYSAQTDTEFDVFDKSGYNLYVKRKMLESKAKELKAKRELNNLQRMDFSKQNEIIRTRIFNTKNDLIEKLQEASFDTEWKTTQESAYKTILDKLEDLNRLYIDYLKHLKNLQDAYNNSENYYRYNTPDDVLQAIVKFNDRLDNMVVE